MYKIIWLEQKSPDWIVANLQDDKGQYASVSINRVSKQGVPFPNFENLQNGGEVEGNLWLSPKGKYYLYAPNPEEGSELPPRAQTTTQRAYTPKSSPIKQAMKQKEESIAKFQDSKENSIKLAGAQRDAVLIVTTMMQNLPAITSTMMGEDSIKEAIIKWRNWFLNDEEFNSPPPF